MVEAKGSSRLFLHYAIGLALMFGFGWVPAVGPLTPFGMEILGIFLGLAYLWSTTDGIWASLLGLIAVGLTGYQSYTEIMAAALSNQNVLVIFFTLILFGSAVHCGLPRYIAHFFLSQKLIDGRPMVFTLLMMVAAYIVAALTDAIPSVLLFWPIVYSILGDLGCRKGEAYSMFLVMGTFFGACLGSATFPFKGAILIALSAFEGVAGQPVPYLPYTIINVVCSLLIMSLYCLLIRFIFRPDLSKICQIDSAQFRAQHLEPLSKAQKYHVFAVLFYIIGVMVTSVLPADLPGAAFLRDLGASGLAVVMLIFLMMVRVEGQPIFHFGEVVHAGMKWNVYFMVAAAVFMAGVLKLPETGILPFFKLALNPLLGGHSELVFALLLFGFAMILTCFFHNGVLANMLMPIVFAFSEVAGYHGAAIAVVLTLAINVSFLTPAASVYAPLLHSNTDWVSFREIILYGGAFALLSLLCFTLVGLPLAELLF